MELFVGLGGFQNLQLQVKEIKVVIYKVLYKQLNNIYNNLKSFVQLLHVLQPVMDLAIILR